MNHYLRHRAFHQRMTSAWTSTAARSEAANTGVNSFAAGEVVQPHAPHPPAWSVTAPPSGTRAVYPVTRGRDYGTDADDRGRPAAPGPAVAPRDRQDGAGNVKGAGPVVVPSVPQICVTDCSKDGVTEAEVGPSSSRREMSVAWEVPSPAQHSPAKPAVAPSSKTTTILTPSPPQPALSRPMTEPPNASGPSVSLPSMARSLPPARSRSVFTSKTEDKTRLTSASHSLWPGDPRAIRSVRRSRRDIEEMLASMKAGEETRRLIRETNPPCSRYCSQPNILAEMERTYVNLPDLLPEIEKARQRMSGEEAGASVSQLTSADRRRVGVGRFDLDDDVDGGSKNLPIYQINYSSLRDIGGNRKNSVLS